MMMGDQVTSSVAARARAGGPLIGHSSTLLALLVVVMLLVLDRSQLATEWRFFHYRALVSAAGFAPVPQDDAATPALDAALRAAATLLPRGAVCVVGVDAWQRTYFRASYVLMPRRVWPAANRPSSVSTAQLDRALALHHAGCALVPPGGAAPSGLRLDHGGAIDLYVAARGRRTP